MTSGAKNSRNQMRENELGSSGASVFRVNLSRRREKSQVEFTDEVVLVVAGGIVPLVVRRLIHDHAVHKRASVRLVHIPIRMTPLDGAHARLCPHPVSASSLVVASRPPTFRSLELCKKKRERGYKVQLWDLQKHCFRFSLIVYCFRREICRRVVVVRKLINHWTDSGVYSSLLTKSTPRKPLKLQFLPM